MKKKKPKLRFELSRDSSVGMGFQPSKKVRFVYQGRQKKHIGAIVRTFRNAPRGGSSRALMSDAPGQPVWIYVRRSDAESGVAMGTPVESFHGVSHCANLIAKFEGAEIDWSKSALGNQ